MDDTFVNGLVASFRRQVASMALEKAEAYGQLAQMDARIVQLKAENAALKKLRKPKGKGKSV